ncbi:MAG: alpha/beta hydrolase [Sandaracinaceae bacterium]
MSAPIVFVHGMFMTGSCWEPIAAHFTSLGHRCLTPSWPCRDGEPEALRAAPDPGLRALTLTHVVDHMAAQVEALDEPPILVGHSMGGLIVQLLAQSGLGSRVVAIAPAPPHGVRSFAFSHLKSNSALLWPSSAPVVPSFSWFRYAFANQGSEDEARALYDTYAVPESRLVGRGPLGPEGKLDLTNAKQRMLFLSGSADHIIPAPLVQKVVDRHRAAGVDVSNEVLDGTHLMIRDERWSEVAAHIQRWLDADLPAHASRA